MFIYTVYIQQTNINNILFFYTPFIHFNTENCIVFKESLILPTSYGNWKLVAKLRTIHLEQLTCTFTDCVFTPLILPSLKKIAPKSFKKYKNLRCIIELFRAISGYINFAPETSSFANLIA